MRYRNSGARDTTKTLITTKGIVIIKWMDEVHIPGRRSINWSAWFRLRHAARDRGDSLNLIPNFVNLF